MQLSLAFLLLQAWLVFGQECSKLCSDLDEAGVKAVFPNDPDYAKASQAFNLRFEYRPAAIVYPTTTEQVAAALQAGVGEGLSVVARSGGHSYVANGLGGKDGALVIDLSSLTSISVNEADNTAVLGVGNKLGDVALALNEYGRAIPHGRCSYVGLGGHSAFGGYGFPSSRMWGLTLDAVVAIEVVLANGTITTASEAQNPDLFWALRGSAPSFGINTFITVSTHQVPDTGVFATYQWNDVDISNATEAFSAFQDFVDSGIPSALGTQLNFYQGSQNGTVTLEYRAAFWGPRDDFNATVEPYLSQFPEPDSGTFYTGNWIDTFDTISYPSLDTSAPDTNDTFYAKSVMTPEAEPLTYEAMQSFVTYLATDGVNSPVSWFVETELYGGSNSAINQVPLDSTSFAHRSTRFTMQLYGSVAQPPFPESGFTFISGMASSIIDTMPANWDYGAYTNYIEDRLENWQHLYYGDHYQTLQNLKSIYDPEDVFYFPSSIEEL